MTRQLFSTKGPVLYNFCPIKVKWGITIHKFTFLCIGNILTAIGNIPMGLPLLTIKPKKICFDLTSPQIFANTVRKTHPGTVSYVVSIISDAIYLDISQVRTKFRQLLDIFSDTLLVVFLLTIYSLNTLSLSSSTIFWLYNGVYFSFIQVFHGLILPWQIEWQKVNHLHSFDLQIFQR